MKSWLPIQFYCGRENVRIRPFVDIMITFSCSWSIINRFSGWSEYISSCGSSFLCLLTLMILLILFILFFKLIVFSITNWCLCLNIWNSLLFFLYSFLGTYNPSSILRLDLDMLSSHCRKFKVFLVRSFWEIKKRFRSNKTRSTQIMPPKTGSGSGK